MALKKRTKVIITLLCIAAVCVIVFYDFSSDRALVKEIQSLYGVDDSRFVRSMNYLLGPSLIEGNQVETLLNGDEFFPSMLQAIESAQKTITLESYIYWSGESGRKFTTALTERAKVGVKIHLLLDFVGSSRMDRDLLKEMENAGVQIAQYNALPWFSLRRVNNRTHRKILVVDGKIGFTGGAGIADHWLGNADSPEHWRDTHYRFEGPVVGQMQAAFMDNWLAGRGELLHGDDYFPAEEKKGNQLAQVFKSSPSEGSETARLMYLLSIASARKNIFMSNAYFVPDDLSVRTFVSAAKRGVKIKIITPGKITDTKIVRSASRSRWGELLKAGVEFFEYQPTMFHCKVMVVDDLWSSVGSTNFDNRSFRLNDEVNLNVYDREFALEQVRDFQEDLKKSKQITYEEWKNRPLFEKFKDWMAGLLKHQL
jgi:cardiolipin synthase A/B